MEKQKLHKREQEVFQKIHEIVRMLKTRFQELAIDPSIKVLPEMYYDESGLRPCKFIELSLGWRTSLRLGLERQIPGWGLGWNIFANGQEVEEEEVQVPKIKSLRTPLADALDHYLHVYQHQERVTTNLEKAWIRSGMR
jgi:hypothetical protein